MVIAEDLMCQHEWPDEETEAKQQLPHQCRLMEGHKGVHKCTFVNCGATAPNDEKAI